MRLKYFMRGLGSGIVLTAALAALTTKPQISDAEIIERAAKLGMVSKEEAGLDEGDLKELSKNAANDNKDTDNKEANTNDDNKTDETSEDETADKEASKDTSLSDKSSTDGADQKPVETKVEEKAEESLQKIKVTIKSGMYSYSVSKALEDAGVIDSAKEFDQYLIKHNYQRRIIPGTYEIQEGDSYDKIAEIITK
ncbi:YceG-like family protein [Mobilisporobacter senegalensis]|uniref:YceG-like family protein n=1 Tax=Mobilisporobacter senegalensis TaxID=1329262 RepID=A0A3N1Y0M2_9FIRM|nr:endolytic transglycosylase MltG [Mobilisporobacter senegalensis]ROR30797.1 YceG-like family protein [Mobilisporobacter senegalensis]